MYIQDLSKLKKEDMSMLDFPVARRPANFFKKDGTIQPQVNHEFIVREDTEEPLGLISKKYALVPHADFITAVEKFLHEAFSSNFVTNTIMGKNGATMIRHYFFPEMLYQIQDKDDFIPALRVVNSYNRSSLYGIYLDTLRLVCNNGMLGLTRLSNISYKHVGKVDFTDVKDAIYKIAPSMDALQFSFKSWNETNVSEERARMLAEKLVPKRLRNEVMYKFEYDGNFTRMGFYNALTYTYTHVYKPHSDTPEFARMDKGISATKLALRDELFLLPLSRLTEILD